MSATRTINICADDFGHEAARDDAIVRLAESGRVSAVSCFTDSARWPAASRRLRSGPVQLGLHFNLTLPFGHGEHALAIWLARALTGAVRKPLVHEHFARQLDRFVQVVGRLPDFVDGHEHVHAFPRVADIVIEAMIELAGDTAIRLRAITPFFGLTDAPFKRWVLTRISAQSRLSHRCEPIAYMNTGFAGDYSLRLGADYPRLFDSWLATAPPGGLIMCHPSLHPGSAGEREHAFLSAARFADACEAHGVAVGTTEGFSPITTSNAPDTRLRGAL